MPANVETMAYRFADRSDVPWHGLGVKVSRNDDVTTDEFRRLAGADWIATKRKLYFRLTPDGLPDHEVPNTFALARSDNNYVLNIVSQQYKAVQNKEVFNFFAEFCERLMMTMETGGVLDNGKTVWALAALGKGFTLANGDRVTGNLLLANSHSGNALLAKFTPVRVVCANTLAMALSGGQAFRLNHKTKFDPEDAKRALGLSEQSLETFHAQSLLLSNKRMTGLDYIAYLDSLFPKTIMVDPTTREQVEKRPRNYEKAIAALVEQPGRNMSEGTWWQGFNAITYMLDHGTRTDKAAQLSSNWFGAGHNLKIKALETALEMAK